MGNLDGSCLCGNVRYTCDADPVGSANCHCSDCQKSTGAAFSTIVIVPSDAFAISGDTLSYYKTTGDDHGQAAKRYFCSNCGSTLFTASDAYPGVVFIKTGTLEDTSLVAPAIDVWCDSKQSWTDHGQRLATPRGPSEEAMARAATGD